MIKTTGIRSVFAAKNIHKNAFASGARCETYNDAAQILVGWGGETPDAFGLSILGAFGASTVAAFGSSTR